MSKYTPGFFSAGGVGPSRFTLASMTSPPSRATEQETFEELETISQLWTDTSPDESLLDVGGIFGLRGFPLESRHCSLGSGYQP